jgi:hypothetical protein
MHKWLELISSKGGCITEPCPLKQRRMYNLTMSCGRVLLDTLKHFLNYEKIITARMHARSNDDVDNKTSDEMTRKWGTRQTEQPLRPEHPGYSTSFNLWKI